MKDAPAEGSGMKDGRPTSTLGDHCDKHPILRQLNLLHPPPTTYPQMWVAWGRVCTPGFPGHPGRGLGLNEPHSVLNGLSW